MSIEKPTNSPDEGQSVVEAMEKLIQTQIQYNPEYQKLGLSPEEVHKAAVRLSNAEVAGSDQELAEKAIRAQVRMRANRAPVVDNSGEVIGMASTKEEAGTIARKDAASRDAA